MYFITARSFKTYVIYAVFLMTIFSNSVYAYENSLNFDFDKSSPTTTPTTFYGRIMFYDTTGLGFVCLSDTDATYGACDTQPDLSKNVVSGSTDIKLVFTEQRSHAKAIVTLTGYRQIEDTPWRNIKESKVTMPKFNNTQTKINLAWADYTFTNVSATKNISIKPRYESYQAQFKIYFSDSTKVPPYGGIWKATLKLKAYREWSDAKVHHWYPTDTFNITLKMTDNGNIQMYLPNLSGATPTVDLRLVSHPFAKPDATESGDASIESCLYDGYNSNSTKFTLEATNPDSSENGFYVTAVAPTKSSTADSTYIYYNVSASNPGDPSDATIPLTSGVPQTFTISDSAPFRLVTLPGITGNVECVPWTIHLQTPSFDQKDKQPGYYKGTLNILFTPSTDQ